MKIQNALLTGALALAALSSCTSEDFEEKLSAGGPKGELQLSVDVLKPESTRAVIEVTDFPVIIYDAEGKTIHSYSTVADVPSSIMIAVGNYTVESHTPGAIRKKMAEAYYRGVTPVEIIKDVTSPVNVLCKMQNSVITVNYDDEFRSVFASWEITINDGGETVLSFDNTNATNKVYWYFGEEGVKELTVNFRGTTTEGSTVSSKYTLTKDQADESYDDDRQNFGGGDALNINFTPTESTEGKLTGVTINADVTFTETNESVDIVVIDVPGFEPGGGDEPDPTPGGDEGNITLNLPADISFPAFGASSVDPSLGDTYIAAAAGLKSIIVKIESTSSDMISSLGELNAQYGVDFINGAEIVGNQSVETLFENLGQPLTVPNEGDTEYNFPIGNFFGFLQVLVGKHTCLLTVHDMNGAEKSGSLNITITE